MFQIIAYFLWDLQSICIIIYIILIVNYPSEIISSLSYCLYFVSFYLITVTRLLKAIFSKLTHVYMSAPFFTTLSLASSFLTSPLQWVPIPCSRGSSRPRDQTQVSCFAGRFFTIWATRGAPVYFIGAAFPSFPNLLNWTLKIEHVLTLFLDK